MKHTLEKMSLLGLSFMLVSTFAISPLLPQMIADYTARGISNSQINMLVSIPSFIIMAVVLAGPLLGKLISEKTVFIMGLIGISLGGSLPVLTQAYSWVLLSRIILGLGIGLINERAITIVSQHFFGAERTKMLGFRGSMEVLGSATLTFLAGQLLKISWSAGFLIYSIGLPILIFYLVFGSKNEVKESKISDFPQKKREKLTRSQLSRLLFLAIYAGSVIVINTGITVRLPLLVEELGLGTAVDSSLVLSLMMLMGILAGTLFAALTNYFGKYLQAVVLFLLAFGLILIWLAPNLIILAIGALTTGLVYSIGVTSVFHKLTDFLSTQQLALGTTLVLLGCNLGGGLAASVMSFLVAMTGGGANAFLILAILCVIAGIILLSSLTFKKKSNNQV
ncbi:Predicted arabinose efflux permease, MFS family [Streptococcus henryi]|uniref:Predicted arabinose efflux permease, MFS family n=1 Tax=Streptococcus henryi TaxID=439219 RepID=A0A1G6D1J3_9STRE|nr:MFS transporter [Streptococcus henryi]SDB39037.1 Predicted arabinose efflux permease, MFS family [Streptococcus henryi]